MAKRNLQLVQDSVNGLETSNGVNVAEVTGAVTDNAIARFNGTTGAIQGSGVVVDDSGNLGLGVTPSVDTSLTTTTNILLENEYSANEKVIGVANIPATAYRPKSGGNLVVKAGGCVAPFSQSFLGGNLRLSAGDGTNNDKAGSVTIESGINAGSPSTTSSGSIIFKTGNKSERMRIDSSGNVGIGVTPSAWHSASKAIEIGAKSSLSSLSIGDGYTMLSHNCYSNTSQQDTYVADGYASIYLQNNGTHKWYTGPSGTAGNHITLTTAMTLGANSNLTIKSPTSVDSILAIDATSTNVSQRLHFKANGTLQAEVYNDSTQTIIKTVTNTPLKFGTNNTVSVVIPTTGGIQLPNTAITDATTLDWYEEATATLTATGMTTLPTGTATFTRVGNTVTMEIPAIIGTSNAAAFTLTVLPTNFRPSTFRNCLARIVDNGTAVIGTATIGTNGIITMSTVSGVGFTASGIKGTSAVSCSYQI